MFTPFRQCYPQGSLLSELITIDCGQYVVRVSVQVDGITLATGLAAARLIEEAEDKARQRALETLDFTVKSAQSVTVTVPNPTPSVSPPPSATIADPSPLKIEPEPEIIPEKPKSSAKKSKKTQDNLDSAKISPPLPEIEIPVTPSVPTPEPEIEDIPSEMPESLDIQESIPEDIPLSFTEAPSEPEVIPEPDPSPSLSDPQEDLQPALDLTESLDFSDIIAQSNAELKRLRWTQEEGRDYLIRTYGKRSRQLLSDEELIEFLDYLKGLPTPPRS